VGTNVGQRIAWTLLTDCHRLMTGQSSLDRRARAALELWLEECPSEERDALQRRLGADDRAFHAAFFELFLHALFKRLGFEAEVHPQVSFEHERTPDFLMRRGGVPQFYLEATVVLPDANQIALHRRLQKMAEALHEVVSGDFDLGLERADFPEESFPRKIVIRSVQKWLESLDPVKVNLEMMVSNQRGRPEGFTDGGLSLRVWAMPRPIEARGLRTPVRVIPVSERAQLVVCVDAIRRKIDEKKRHYGPLLLPYVIAVNALEGGCDVEDIQNAAFGSLSTHISGEDAGRLQTATVRSDDGAISDPGRESSRRVSAVLAETGLTPWSMFEEERITPVLVRNTDADRPLSAEDLPILSIADGHDGPESFAVRQFVPARKILGLDRQVIL